MACPVCGRMSDGEWGWCFGITIRAAVPHTPLWPGTVLSPPQWNKLRPREGGSLLQGSRPLSSEGGTHSTYTPAASHSRPRAGLHHAPAAGQRSPHSAPPSRLPGGPAVPPVPAAAGSAAAPAPSPAPAMPPPGDRVQAHVTQQAGPRRPPVNLRAEGLSVPHPCTHPPERQGNKAGIGGHE